MINPKNINYRISIESECAPIAGNALDSGDPETDRKYEKSLLRAVRNGRQWSWCQVTVTAELLDGFDVVLSASTYLGCCSYGSEHDFRNCDYYADMKTEVLEELEAKVASVLKCLTT